MSGVKKTKKLLGATAASAPLRPLMRRLFKRRANIVYYHFVGRTEPFYKEFSGDCSLERFEQDLKLLRSCFDIVPLQQVLQVCKDGEPPSAPIMAVTFDDGFDLVRGGAMEILDQHNIQATVFLITSCIDNQNLMWRNKISAIINSKPAETLVSAYNRVVAEHKLPLAGTMRDVLAQSMQWPMHLKEEMVDKIWAECGMPPLQDYLEQYQPYLTWQDIEQWRANGHEIGLHTHTHPVCAALTDDQVLDEIVRPAEMLKQRFSMTDLPFSYPFGIRLPAEKERSLIDNATVQCACGIAGGAPLGSPLQKLERTGIEAAVGFPLFGKTLIKATGLL